MTNKRWSLGQNIRKNRALLKFCQSTISLELFFGEMSFQEYIFDEGYNSSNTSSRQIKVGIVTNLKLAN